MGALADHASAVEHDDEVAVDDGRQPVRDHDEGATGRDGVDGLAHALLVQPVERRGRLVEQQDRRRRQQRARDREALPFAAREHDARLTDGCVEPERRPLEHLAEVHRAQHALARRIGCLGGGEPQVVADRAGERRGILLDVAELCAQSGAVDPADVGAVEQHRAGVGVVEALDEREGRRFARARGSDERDPRAARDRERDIVQHVAVRVGDRSGVGVDIGEGALGLLLDGAAGADDRCGVGEPHAAELDRRGVARGQQIADGLDRAGEIGIGAGAAGLVGGGGALGVVRGLGGEVEHLLDAPERAERLIHRGDGAEERPERLHEEEEEHHERHELRDGDGSRGDPETAHPEHDQQRELQRDAGDRHDERGCLRDLHARVVGAARGLVDRRLLARGGA